MEIIAIYEKRWKVEEYHKSIKSNIGIGKSPTDTIKTQLNHIFASLYAFVKLEKIGHKLKKNHFAVQKLLYIPALQVAYKILMQICWVACVTWVTNIATNRVFFCDLYNSFTILGWKL